LSFLFEGNVEEAAIEKKGNELQNLINKMEAKKNAGLN
jgi:hypothetical protein